jgi:Glyoxalase-like domain
MRVTRLRQAVVVHPDRDAVLAEWKQHFALGDGFSDPGVGAFGLHNWVVPVGDCFLEVVSPVSPNTTAGRYMDRHNGPAGYMVIFQVESIDDARDHLRAEQCRTVWDGDFDEIAGTHLHPADVGGAIVSVDEPRPASSWMWAGPTWTQNVQSSIADRLAGITVADRDADALASRWGRLLGMTVVDREAVLPDGSVVRFVDSASVDGRLGLVGIDLRASSPATAGRSVTIARTQFRTVAMASND